MALGAMLVSARLPQMPMPPPALRAALLPCRCPGPGAHLPDGPCNGPAAQGREEAGVHRLAHILHRLHLRRASRRSVPRSTTKWSPGRVKSCTAPEEAAIHFHMTLTVGIITPNAPRSSACWMPAAEARCAGGSVPPTCFLPAHHLCRNGCTDPATGQLGQPQPPSCKCLSCSF